MVGKVCMITQLALIVFVLDGMMSAQWPDPAPGPSTPAVLRVKLDTVGLKTGIRSEDPYIYYITTTTPTNPVDVIASSTGKKSPSTNTSDSAFGTAPVPRATYKSVKLVLDGMATYMGTDPCTGEDAPDDTIELPNMVAASDDGLNKVILKYQEPHPVNGLPADSLRIAGFDVTGPFEFRLIFPASNSVICAADVPPLRTISGTVAGPNGLALDSVKNLIFVTNGGSSSSVTAYDSTGTASDIRASISGASTGLSGPSGIYVDGQHSEIGVANSGNSSVTIYDNGLGAPLGNALPLYIINGSSSKLSQPGGIAIYPDSGDSIIVAANGGNNSLTFYSRNALVKTNIVSPVHTLVGFSTGLNFPCGLYVDTTHQEIGVANNGNNSITIYDLTMSVDGNVSPIRTIQGPDAGLSVPCGLYVDVDPLHDEIGVANFGNDTITFYPRTYQGDVAPTRTLRGNATGLDGPVGVYLDTDQIVVANKAKSILNPDSITTYNRVESGVQLKGPPALHISAEQQALLVQYFYSGNLVKDTQTNTGIPVMASSGGYDCDGDGTPDILAGEPILCFDGYHFDWKITDDRVRQLGDASTLGMIPPNNAAFRLANGSVVSVLSLGCPVLTPFTNLDLFSNCPPTPLIIAPIPPVSGEYAIPAVLFMETQLTNKLLFTSTALTSSQFPQLIPTVGLDSAKMITDITWKYASETDDPSTSIPPLIVSQQVQINLTQDIGLVNPCYTQVAGNAQGLVYVSGPLASDIRDSAKIINPQSQPMINNNGCGIKLSDVSTITFTVTDALGNDFVFDWNPT